jgi:hypothetical protein
MKFWQIALVSAVIAGCCVGVRAYQNMFYTVDVEGQKYQFPVSLEDIGGATLTAEFKAITLMRYICKALADGTFVRGT